MATDGNQTYCGDHFVVYKIIESRSCTPKTNIILQVNFTSIKKKWPGNIHSRKAEFKACLQQDKENNFI